MRRHSVKKVDKMTKLASEKVANSLIEELHLLVDQSIDSMSSTELKAFEKKRKKIMAGAKRHESDSGAPRETGEPERQALRA